MREIGYAGEDIAADYLISRGYKIIARNFTRRCGEIDIIAEEKLPDKKVLVFAEVKYYKENSLRDLREAVDAGKQKRIIRTAERYLWENKNKRDSYVRFDAVLITAAPQKIELVKDAFRADRD